MLRLGLARPSDWTGSAVDFVAKGMARHCRANGIAKVSDVFPQSNIMLLDEIMALNDYERSQQARDEPATRMFLLVDYEQAAMVQMGPTLEILNREDPRLPAAFFQVFAHNLARWAKIYDFRDAEFHAENQSEMWDEEETKESFYPQVKPSRPLLLNDLPEYPEAIRFLRRKLPRLSKPEPREIIRTCLEMDNQGRGYELAPPYALRDVVPELEDYLENTEEPGPAALLVTEEGDLVEACFTEEMDCLGQNYPIACTNMLMVDLTQAETALDRQLRKIFDYLGAMLRSLARAAELIETIRRIYDEDLRQRGLESRV